MFARLNVVVVAAMVVVGCASGGDAPEENCAEEVCSTESAEQTALCCWCANPPPGCGGDPDPEPTPVTKRFAFGLWNGAYEARTCSLSYTYTNVNGSTVSGSSVSGEYMPAQSWRGSIVDTLLNSAVTLTASCQHPNYPAVTIQASRTITTLPMDKERTCRAIFTEYPTPTVKFPCWEGPVTGPVTGIEFVTAVKNNGASVASVGLTYRPMLDDGSVGSEVTLLNGQQVAASNQTRTGMFSPIGKTTRVRVVATTNGVTHELLTDVAMNDPSLVTVFNINPDGSVFMNTANF